MARPSKNPKLKYKRVSISLPPDVEEALRSKSWDTGLSMGEIVTEALKKENESSGNELSLMGNPAISEKTTQKRSQNGN